ncbi:CDP-glycerol glycerophosphotransferase family protein [Streptomyces himalayensis]|uniref:CDP-glycerol glycerophosphotransferase family protein n=1 Tax=Streptomyces himalayensis subsp. himalayensis TaxID=2756131 RepID=A0A7W0DQX2_9ACTN|nr:CDP-glycerol glycerophosphotransferase family protein [Streptomyces himalayensis]MBA2949546.1 CDP-glycerol glycerophosphotransferase family protein [Streptomyces himalayensis subsp. himalayensis]
MQPSLSVIVYGRNVQGHLDESLDAICLDDPGADVEVIVAAVGPSAQRVAEVHAARDPRIVPVALPQDTTDAAARAAGAEQATGRWLQFVRSKDALPPGAQRAVAEHTGGLPDSVDVLLFDHVRSTWNSQGAAGRDSRVLAKAGPAPVALTDFPGLLRVAPLLGNRALRAEFWHAHAAEFRAPDPSGPHGAGPEPPTDDELFAAYATLLCSTAVACFGHVCLDHRQLRPASLPPPTPEELYAQIGQYEDVQRLMAVSGAPAALRATVYDVMVSEWLRIIARGGLSEPLVREFFHRASRAAVAWRPEGHARPAGLGGVQRSLLEQDAYVKYRLLQAANHRQHKARSALATRKRKVRAKVGARVRDFRYHRELRRPVDPCLAVFSAYWDRGVACNPAAIAAELARLAPHIYPVWTVSAARAPLVPPGTDHVVAGTRRYWEVMARARYFVNNVNFPGAVVKRPEAVHVMTHHGTPLKRMGLDQREYPAVSKGFNFRGLLARVDKWDYSVSANSHSTEVWEHAYPAHYTSLDYGYPRNDVFYRAGADDILAIREKLGIAPGRTAILYAPTHRDYEATWTPRLDLASLAERLGEDTVLLVRGHYFYSGAAAPPAWLRRSGRIIDVSSYDPVEELALASDAMVTDYSSIMFDYANLDRPIVVYADDWETYAKTRGVYFDLMEEAPGRIARTQDELAEIFTSGAWRDETAAKARAAFRRRFCEFDDGHAAERVVRRVFLGESEESLPPVVPIDERTPAPTPEEAAPR